MKYTLLVLTAGAVLVAMPANAQGRHAPLDPRIPPGQLPPSSQGEHHDDRSGDRVDGRYDPVIWDGQHRDRGRHRGHGEKGEKGEKGEHGQRGHRGDDRYDRRERDDHDDECDDEGENEGGCGYRSGRNHPDGRYPDGRYPDGRYPDGRYPDGRYPDGRYPDNRYPSTLPDMIWGTIFGRGQAVNEVRRWVGAGDVHSRVNNLNRNGSPQVVSWYDAGGQILQRWVDRNRDGRADQVEIFRNGKVVRIVR